MNDFDNEDRSRDRGNVRDRGYGRRGGRGRGELQFGYKENEMSNQPFRTRRPRGGAGIGGGMDRPFRNQRADFGFESPQFRQYDNPTFSRDGFFEGRSRGWRRGPRYPRGGGGYIRNRNPQDSYYNDAKFQGADRLPPDVGMGYAPGQEGRRGRRQNGGIRRYDNNNENGNIGGYERKRYGDGAIGGRYRRGGRRGRGQMRNNNGFDGGYNNRGGQGRRMNKRYQLNSGRRGRNQRGNQRNARQEEKKVPFLNETVHIESIPDVKSDVEDDKKEKQETTIPNTGQFTLHYWDAPTIENLPPLEEK